MRPSRDEQARLCGRLAGATGCSSTGAETGATERVTVLAAASLTDVMPQLLAPVQERHPDRTYEVSYAGSSQIVQQLNSGARADAVVLAGQGPLRALDDGLRVGELGAGAVLRSRRLAPPARFCDRRLQTAHVA